MNNKFRELSDWWHFSKGADTVAAVIVLAALLVIPVSYFGGHNVKVFLESYWWVLALLLIAIVALLLLVTALAGLVLSGTFLVIAKISILLGLAYGVFNEIGIWTALSVLIALIYIWDTRSRYRQLENLVYEMRGIGFQQNNDFDDYYKAD